MSARERGFALLIVLWTLVFLAFLMTQIMTTSRTAVRLAGNLRAAAQARAAADGAINEAVFHLLGTGDNHWPADGATHLVTVGGVTVTVRARSLAGMVNPNLASAALLDGLLQAVEVPEEQAAPLADAIVTWRGPPDSPADEAAALAVYRRAGRLYGPPGRSFATLAELTDVLGMTPAIFGRLQPHLSLFQPADPDPTVADKVVARALAIASGLNPNADGYTGAPVVAIAACAAAPAALCRNAVVSLPGTGSGTPYRFLSWDDGYGLQISPGSPGWPGLSASPSEQRS
jgi:general secretion pathway protein K